MAYNPADVDAQLNNPTERANQLNDPQFENAQGYFPYDLTHQEFITPLFGQVTPSMCVDTVPGDRMVCRDNVKTILNTINGNFLSTLNQYVDTFYVPLRSLYPTNYEKLIPNPTKGSDLPNAALPQVPFSYFVYNYLTSQSVYTVAFNGVDVYNDLSIDELMTQDLLIEQIDDISSSSNAVLSFAFGRLLLMSTILSRGQLLDYLGCSFDRTGVSTTNQNGRIIDSELQKAIDDFQRGLYAIIDRDNAVYSTPLSLTLNSVNYDIQRNTSYDISTLSQYRSSIADIFEKGHMPYFSFNSDVDINTFISEEYSALLTMLKSIFYTEYGIDDSIATSFIDSVNAESNPFQVGYLNIAKPLAYQQCIAQYYTNNSVDNIFNSDLYMQLLRAVMYPSEGGFSSEPTFLYNGVTTEYDYISCGGFVHSLLSDRTPGHLNRQYVFSTLMFLMRRSLRYGDYFATARPNMLAVGQLSINVDNGAVSPIDVTRNLLMQRYLNAANYIGSGFLPYYASIFGVTPSDTGTFPRFVAHRKIELQNQITNNTADNQGYQTTNLVGYSDENGFDVFIDDIGVIISLISYDVLPVYKSGIDASYHFSDRFDYFNPMLQGIGDQPIYLSEMIGSPAFHDDIFGYTMRNAELKYKNSRAHGAFVNSLPGFMLSLPLSLVSGLGEQLKIDSDFIRDKPGYLDSVIPQMTGISPGEYYHFIVSCTNQLQTARKIQATPPVLF